MQGRSDPVWRVYIRSFAAAAVFTVPSEAMVYVLWGMVLYPDGNIVAKLIWTAVDAVVMALAIGLMVGFIVGQRYEGAVAAVISSFCYAIVLFGGILIGYEIEMEMDLFGVQHDTELFVLTSIVPALLTAPLYGWLLHSKAGKALLVRVGL